MKLFIQLYAEQNGKCAVSGRRLLPPEHKMFYCQGSHLLPKGTYPEEKLVKENIVMILKEYHDEWTEVKEQTDAWLVANNKAYWIPIVTRFRARRAALYGAC